MLFVAPKDHMSWWHHVLASLGAITVKYTTTLPCIGESTSKLYTNFEFCEGKNYKRIKNSSLQSQAIYVDKKIQEKFTYFRRWCK